MGKLRDVLEKYEFPLLLAAEWGQPERLLRLLDLIRHAAGQKVQNYFSLRRDASRRGLAEAERGAQGS